MLSAARGMCFGAESFKPWRALMKDKQNCVKRLKCTLQNIAPTDEKLASRFSTAIATGIFISSPILAQASRLEILNADTTVNENAGQLMTNINLNVDDDPFLNFVEGPCDVTGGLVVSSGSATDGEDFSINDSRFSVTYTEEGVTTDSVSISIIDDTVDEENEDFTVTLGNINDECSFYGGLDNLDALTVTIIDNDEPTANDPDPSNEGEEGTPDTDTNDSETLNVTETPDTADNAEVPNLVNEQVLRSMSALTVFGANLQLQNLVDQVSRLRQGLRHNDYGSLKLNIDGQMLSGNALGEIFNLDGDSGALNSGWDTFFGGNLQFGDDEGSDVDVRSLIAGIDHRIGETVVVGAVIGYTEAVSDQLNSAGETELDGYSVGLLGSFYHQDQFFVDGILSLGNSDYQTTRDIDGVPNGLLAMGETSGEELGIALNGGWSFNQDQYFLTLFGSVNYIKASIDAFTEAASSGSSVSLLSVNKQDVNSLTTKVGVQAGLTINTDMGIIRPQLSADWERQYEDEVAEITGQFISNSSVGVNVQSTQMDSNHFNLGLLVSFIWRDGISAFVGYETDIGRDQIKLYDVSLGVRFEL